jgi:hypothetical protein
MADKLTRPTLWAVIGILLLAACGSNSDDVPSLNTEDTQVVEPTAEAADGVLDDEAKVMAFTQCMRDQGIEFLDPVVDSDGNVQEPKLAEGGALTREELGQAYEACAERLEGLTFGRERGDVTERLDQFLALATCLREKGYDVDEPTAETLQVWLGDFRVEFDWDDPEAMEAYEECSSAD